MFGPLVGEAVIPSMKQLYIYSPKYMAKVHLVSRSIGGNCLRRPRPGLSNPLRNDLYLVGAFVGIELFPRFLMLREGDELYNSIADFNRGNYNVIYLDSWFEWTPMNTYWKIWRE